LDRGRECRMLNADCARLRKGPKLAAHLAAASTEDVL
jgi:hypothetical protein